MASDVSTIQSLKAVDAWIDVINANINGGVRTAFKSSLLKFSGSNVDIQRAGGANSLPLQMPEAGLTTANTVIDFTQGAVTASTENAHLAVQGNGFFLLTTPAAVNQTTGSFVGGAETDFWVTRDGEFRTNQNGLLVHSSGLILVTATLTAVGADWWLGGGGIRAVYNNLDNTANAPAAMTAAVRLSDFVTMNVTSTMMAANGTTAIGTTGIFSLLDYSGKQSLQYSQYGSTVFDIGYVKGGAGADHFTSMIQSGVTSSQATILTKSLEASNASMTQSVPELSLAQKLFSALTKVLQTKQTNVDGVLNLVR
jgi:flagellar hook protein FlgE